MRVGQTTAPPATGAGSPNPPLQTSEPGPKPSPAPRGRTPPDVKWLLNERAALAGVVSKAAAKQCLLRAKMARLERQLVLTQGLLERAQCAGSRAQSSVEALDATLALAHPRVAPAAGGAVDAWAGKYGERGGLIRFVQDTLLQTAPASLTMTVLVDLASRQFGVTFDHPKDRRSFRKSVSSALVGLHTRGLVEPLHSRAEGSHGVWRWKNQTPTLEALHRQGLEHTLAVHLQERC